MLDPPPKQQRTQCGRYGGVRQEIGNSFIADSKTKTHTIHPLTRTYGYRLTLAFPCKIHPRDLAAAKTQRSVSSFAIAHHLKRRHLLVEAKRHINQVLPPTSHRWLLNRCMFGQDEFRVPTQAGITLFRQPTRLSQSVGMYFPWAHHRQFCIGSRGHRPFVL
ncbi:hypothetical protein D9M68_868330 [compost metagenome]